VVHCRTAEVLRAKGELLLAQHGPHTGLGARNLFSRGFEIANVQDAVVWQLRCATSLARFNFDTRSCGTSRTLLESTYLSSIKVKALGTCKPGPPFLVEPSTLGTSRTFTGFPNEQRADFRSIGKITALSSKPSYFTHAEMRCPWDDPG
jgi:hypothetical protein